MSVKINFNKNELEIIIMYRKKLLVSCMTLCLCYNIGFSQQIEYEAIGPKETEQLEKELCNKMPGYNCAFWPRTEKLNDALPGTIVPKKYTDNIKNWLPRVLNSSLMTQQLDLNSWLGVRNLYFNRNCIIGKFYSVKDPNTLIEFKGAYRSLDITIYSTKLFNKSANEMSKEKIKDIITEILNFPQEKKDKIVLQEHIEKLADTDVFYGKLFCEWTLKSNPFETKRFWWSYIPFWYTKGMLFVSITTVEGNELPDATYEEKWPF
jgi:hypothetical protein